MKKHRKTKKIENERLETDLKEKQKHVTSVANCWTLLWCSKWFLEGFS